MDLHNVEDAGLTPAEQQDMQDAWRVNTAAVGEAVLKKGGFAVPYFTSIQRGGNVSDPVTHCQRDLEDACRVNKTTGRPNIHDQALLLEFSRAPLALWSSNGTLPYFEQDLATFLLVRGRYAWLGYLWSGCTDSGCPAEHGPHGYCDPNCEADDCKPCRFPRPRDSHPFPRPAALDDDYGEPVAGSSCAET
eukprot:SAG22_NODE_8777_length_630_cov_1.725047_1_plen_190_part_01